MTLANAHSAGSSSNERARGIAASADLTDEEREALSHDIKYKTEAAYRPVAPKGRVGAVIA